MQSLLRQAEGQQVGPGGIAQLANLDLSLDDGLLILQGRINAPLRQGGQFSVARERDSRTHRPKLDHISSDKPRIHQVLSNQLAKESGLLSMISEQLDTDINHLEITGSGIRLVATPKDSS